MRPSQGQARDSKRIPQVLSLIAEIWIDQPDTRFNQLIHNLQSDFHQQTGKGSRCFDYVKSLHGMLEPMGNAIDLYNLEDDEFIKYLKWKIERQNLRKKG
ncbi:hypothetical protein AB3N02_21750 [Priestia aryabhattai]|uniref:hypothetical protein n=1 Tax=Priestia aryabhattai TaxID=412384 RepID=UPI0039A2E16C